MQVLVAYYSKTNHTKILAEAICEGVQQISGVDCIFKPISEVTEGDLLSSQGIIIGSPVYFGLMAAEVKYFFDNHIGLRRRLEGKVGAAFATSGDSSGGKETTILSILQAMLIYGMVICGDPLSATGHYGVACLGKPDIVSKNNGQKLGARVASLTKRLFRE